MAACFDGSSETSQTVAVARPLVDFRHVDLASLSGTLPASDELTCLALHRRALILGTHLGLVFRLDLDSQAQVCTLSRNASHIHAVALDHGGHFVATAAADGCLRILRTASSAGEPWACECSGAPLLSVAFSADGASTASDEFVVCVGGEDGRLVLVRKGVLGFRREVIHRGEGFITGVAWSGRLLAWSNDRGVKVYNVATGQKVTYIAKPTDVRICSFSWAEGDRLIVGWSASVQVAKILAQGPTSASSEKLYAEIGKPFCCSHSVRGVADAGSGNLAVLLECVGRLSVNLCNSGGEVFFSAEVPLQHYALSSRLGSMAPHLPMFVLTPRELVMLEGGDLIEHAIGLTNIGRDEDAIRFADVAGDSAQGLRDIVCKKCLVPALRAGDFGTACSVMCRFRRLEASTWRECVLLFDDYGGLHHLALHIPVSPVGLLPKDTYDLVLQRLVAYPASLVAVLSSWPSEIFSAAALAATLRQRLGFSEGEASPHVVSAEGGDSCHVEALAHLSAACGDLLFAVRLLLELGHPEAFRLLGSSVCSDVRLARLAQASIRRLFEIDDHEACHLFVRHRCVISTEAVLAALHDSYSMWAHEYLKKLFAADPTWVVERQTQMVGLFAEHEPQSLLDFLRHGSNYSLQDALVVCRSHGLIEEEAYLLGRSGHTADALQVVLERLGDIHLAFELVADQHDPKLWDLLVDFALEHPHLLVPLIEHLEKLDGSSGKVGRGDCRAQPPPSAKPAQVLRRIPPGTPLARVAMPIKHTFETFMLTVGLHQSCQKLSFDEASARKRTILACCQRGRSVSLAHLVCSLCGRSLDRAPPTEKQGSTLRDDEGLKMSSRRPHGGRETEAQALHGNRVLLRGHGGVHALCHRRHVPVSRSLAPVPQSTATLLPSVP